MTDGLAAALRILQQTSDLTSAVLHQQMEDEEPVSESHPHVIRVVFVLSLERSGIPNER